jgi:hypothetical protein
MNPATPLCILEVFAKNDQIARSNVAANPSTPARLLEVLAKDKNPDVRRSVANVQVCDPMVHYQQVRDAWVGLRNPDGK